MLNETPSKPLAIYRGKPRPFVMRHKVDGAYQAFPAGLSFRAVAKGQELFVLTVGQGITLAAHASVADSMAVIMPTPAQSQLVPKGSFATYEIFHSTPPVVLFSGTLTGEDAGS